MSDVAIRVENLSKLYRIGAREEQPRGLGQTVRSLVASPFAYLQRSRRPPTEEETLWALRDVSFEVRQGEVIGIIGRNGAGKSTLLKILSRITEPSSGEAHVFGRVGSLLEVGTGFHPELTGRENIYLNGTIMGMKRAEIDRKFDEIIAFSEVEKFLDTPVKRYSSGMYVRLAFAVAAHLEPEILLVDEVLAVGDAAFQKKCLGKMGDVAKEGRTVLFVSHNMAAIEHLCTQGIVFDAGNVALISSSSKAVSFYEKLLFSALNSSQGLHPNHVLFRKELDGPLCAVEVVQIEVFDEAGQPKQLVGTWENVTFRIGYRSDELINAGSVVLMISTSHGVPVLLLSTQPDSTLPVQIQPGLHHVDCCVEMLPLSAGEYIVGAGLAVPNKEWLWKDESLARLTVQPRDVYQSGLAPISSRSLLAVPHTWSLP